MEGEAKRTISKDLMPTLSEERNWGIYNFIALWIGMDIGIPTYYLASGLIAGGLDMKGAIFTILLGNVIVMIPILLNGHAGAKYGVPAPIYWRSAFGYKGATLPAIVSAVVAAGWYGIQIWIGGEALNTIIVALYPAWAEFSAGVWICFGLFWLANYAILVNGMGALKKMEAFCAPLLVLWMIILLIWAYNRAGTWGPLVRQTGNFASTGAFLAFFIPALTSNVGYWGPMTLNVTNFTRYAKDQRSQVVGQFVGLPSGIVALALVGSLVTSATVVIFGEAIWDPVALTGMVDNVWFVVGSMFFLMTATLTTNVAANAVAPATVIVQVTEGRVNFKWAVLVLGIIAILIRPWALVGDLSMYQNMFLVGGAAFLGPVAGVIICHYMIVSKTELNVDALYEGEGEYKYEKFKGYNALFRNIWIIVPIILIAAAMIGPAAWMGSATSLSMSVRTSMIAYAVLTLIVAVYIHLNIGGGVNVFAVFSVMASVALVFCGLWIPGLHMLYDASWFIGTGLSIVLYYALMKKADPVYLENKKVEHMEQLNKKNT